MSDNTPTDAKAARKPRKSAPRRRKPADKAATPAKVETAPGESAADAITTGAALPTVAKAIPAEQRAAARSVPTEHPTPQAVAPATPPSKDIQPDRQEATRPAATREPAAGPTPRVLIKVPLEVRWRDLDAFNHVNNSKYLSYLEEARLQWMLTMPGQGLDDHVAPVVAAANLNYRRPIEWPNKVMVELFVERLGNTSVSIGHRIVARDDASVLYCDGNVVMVWIDRGTGTAAPLPAEVRAACR